MIIERSMSDDWLSNAWVVGDRPGGHGVVIDAGGPVRPLFRAIEDNDLTLTHLIVTHHHHDHVANVDAFRERYGVETWGHPLERELWGGIDHDLDDGDEVESGELTIRAMLTPGHTRGMLALIVGDEVVFTGDTLFRESVGGTMAPGHATYEDLKRSIMDRLMSLPEGMRVYPGHTDETTIGHEWEHNPFIRIWRGIDAEGESDCTAFGRPATLVLRASDYDEGTKCWVRFRDGDVDEIVPGSQVKGG